MTESKIPDGLRYTKEHEWFREESGEITLGITDHAQSELTDIVFVELPSLGKPATAGQSLMVLESVKTVADVYAPADGAVSAVNEELKKHPEWINQDPYGKGWIVKIRASGAPGPTLSAEEYRAFLATSG